MKIMNEKLDQDKKILVTQDFKEIEAPLLKQEGNITEPGEQALTDSLRSNFEKLKRCKVEDQEILRLKLRQIANRIMQINMDPIEKKDLLAAQTALHSTWIIGIICTLCFLIAFTFVLNFPSYIASPIKELKEIIKEISEGNYHRTFFLNRNDEFGELRDSINMMSGKLREYESTNLSKLWFEKKRIETIINSLREAILGLDEKQVVIFANNLALDLLGMTEEEVIGRYAPDIAIFNDLLRNLLLENGGKIKIYSQGKECFFTKEYIEIIDNQTFIGKIILLKNITEFKEMDEAKTNFIATISHELKTPISSLKMSLKLLEDQRIGVLNPEQKDLLNNMGEDAQRLMNITKELLDMAQVETGKLRLNLDMADPYAMVNYAVNALKNTADQHRVKLVLNLKNDLPKVRADLEKTTWVISNLLSNSIKYSRMDSFVELSVQEMENVLVFSVQDHGQGIEEQYLDRVFEKYFKIPNHNFETQGTGLGLAIAKDFIEAQGGKIWVRSEIGIGSLFAFSLPISI